MKNSKFIICLLLILFVAIFVRLINLDKAGGLWYDEATIYSIACQNGILGMHHADSHRFLLFPLYYIIYHYWIYLFGNSDLTIRLMSVFFDILSIIVAFFVGKQIGEMLSLKKIDFVYALLYAINSSFIYYAQEAKFYSITFLLINLILLFWLKYINNKTSPNICLLTLFSFLLISAYTSQVLFVILLFITTIIYLLQEKTFNKTHLLLFASCFIPVILLSVFYKDYFSGNFTAVVYDNSFILLAIQNMFTPVLNGLQNNILNYQNVVFSSILNISFWLFIIFPILFITYLICYSCKKYTIIRYIVTIGSVYIFIHILLANYTDYKVLVRYILPVLPLFLLSASVGVDNKLKKVFLALYIIVSILWIFSNSGAPYINRPEGYRALAETIIKADIKNNNTFIFPIRTNLLDKYYQINGEKLSLYDLNLPEAQKAYLTSNEIEKQKTKQNKYIKRFLSDDKITKDFEDYVQKHYIKYNKCIVVLTDKSICLYSNEDLQKIINSKNYEQYPFQFLRMSKLNNDLIRVLSKKMKLKDKIFYKTWEISVFEI